MDGQELNAEILLLAYAQGYFPMPDSQQPNLINWYCPDPRAIIPLDEFHISRSMHKELRRTDLQTKINTAFKSVMQRCSERPETWITEDFFRAYGELHELGFAHSVEIFRGDALVGGVYGVSLGGAFFAESMFHLEKNMSKLALFRLVEHLRTEGFVLLECQFLTEHLQSLGACTISDEEYMSRLRSALKLKVRFT